jgi:hypothetical protein
MTEDDLGGSKLDKCPLCGAPIRIVRRKDGAADHFEHKTPDELAETPNPIPPVLDDFLQAQRVGKKTVAIAGSAWTSRSWAPYGDPDVEVWCFNEMHEQLGVGEPSRWFQLHHKWVWTDDNYTRFNHLEWLKQDRDYPLYMQKVYDGIPGAVRFPLQEIQRKLLNNIWRGETLIKKLFTTSMAYAIAMALYEERFERIELFGIELVMAGEYAYQREIMSFWIGQAAGRGVEIWMPEVCVLLKAPLYAYEETRLSGGGILTPEGVIPLPEK